MKNYVLLLATAAESSITAWDIQTGSQLTAYKGNGSVRNGLCAMGEDYMAAAQANKQAIHIWTWHKEAVLQRSFTPEPLTCLAASPCGTYLAGGGASGQLYLWESGSGRLLRAWPGHYKAVTCLLFVAGPSLLLSAGEDTQLCAWLLPGLLDPAADPSDPAHARPAPHAAWADHTLPVACLAAAPGGGGGEAGALVASGGADRAVKLRRAADGRLLLSVALPAAVTALVLEPGLSALYAGCADGCVYGVPLCPEHAEGGAGRDTHDHLGTHAGVVGGAAANGAAAAQGAEAAAGGPAGGLTCLRGHARPVSCLALCPVGPGGGPGGEVLASGAEDGSARLWDLRSGQPVQVLQAPGKQPVSGLLVLPRPPHLHAGAGQAEAGGGGARAGGGGGGGRGGPRRPQPLAPLTKFAGTPGPLAAWEGAPLALDGAVAGAGLGALLLGT